MARALQLFMPGKQQIWYLDLFAGKNDHEAVKKAGAAGHKEINRTNLSTEQMEQALHKEVVRKQLNMLRFRTRFPAFSFDSEISVDVQGSCMTFEWKKAGYIAVLKADLWDMSYEIKGTAPNGEILEE